MLEKANKIFFIGIGGIGISATARILNEQGKTVIGSDAIESEITDQLMNEGIEVVIGQSGDNITTDVDLVVYTVAILEDNPERQKTRELRIEEMTYPQLLGKLIDEKYGIGVSGTNGKTTTTAMLSKIFIDAKLDPTVVLGSKAEFLGGNSRTGKGEHLIFEGCEYKRSFANYNPKMVVLTHIAEDHLDYYKDLKDIKSAFGDYLEKVPKDGYVFINVDDNNSIEVMERAKAKIVTYGIENKANVIAKDIKIENGKQFFNLYYMGDKMGEIVLQVPALYNIYNALSAIAPALVKGVDFKIIQKSLEGFIGTWRRFQKLGKIGKSEVIVDYAHTPDSIEQTIMATKEFYPNKKILTVFQPHQYSRTKNLFKGFSRAFDKAGKVLIEDIFYVKGRENPGDFDVSAKKLVEAISRRRVDVRWTDAEVLRQEVATGDYDVILMLGAGDTYEMIKNLVNENSDDRWEKEYGDIEVDERTKKHKVSGTGFSQQKAVVEKNKFYSKSKKNVK